MYDADAILSSTISGDVWVSTAIPDVITNDDHKWIDDADFTVILGIILVALLIVGLGAYIAFVIRVTYRENRRAKRLAEILKNMPVEFNNQHQTIRGVNPAQSPSSYHVAAYQAAYNQAYYEDQYDYSEKM